MIKHKHPKLIGDINLMVVTKINNWQEGKSILEVVFESCNVFGELRRDYTLRL